MIDAKGRGLRPSAFFMHYGAKEAGRSALDQYVRLSPNHKAVSKELRAFGFSGDRAALVARWPSAHRAVKPEIGGSRSKNSKRGSPDHNSLTLAAMRNTH